MEVSLDNNRVKKNQIGMTLQNNWIKAIPQFYNDNDQILYYD